MSNIESFETFLGTQSANPHFTWEGQQQSATENRLGWSHLLSLVYWLGQRRQCIILLWRHLASV